MATPKFILDIREKAGDTLLFLPGVVMVVFDARGRILLNKRADNGQWALISGIPDPGEQPAEAAVREILEETAVSAVVERVLSVFTNEPVLYENGDRAQYVDIVLRCRAVGGQARVNDDESLDVRWFAPDELPPLGPIARGRIELALRNDPTWFAPAPAPGLADRGYPAP
ncbi:ADP-ribose pyrophosphatase YjhB, NUDIX family [Streptomyces sp. DvalAA-14]|uniref:NUDIX hydrolase n=1 Tax=unclassified Streptomyces TaxID=2593676 RepID=UPI00081B7A66|nr:MULTISPECIES: NUDIX domain-containing protein [unclassified Streptomyces]MYS24474.1 NUDIX domain-containing protein [Streptomyces sp. SID4948]SCE46424.1 ADP-ribose pyrophosphatase YjhB, NUDIX family [Streptomyces sp. DvalAA-14]